MKKISSEKRTALVFGGSDGIGLATVEALLIDGYTVFNASRSPCAATNVRNLFCDVADKRKIAAAVAAATEEPTLDAVIYSAGFSMASPLEYASDDDYRYLYEVNFFGVLSVLHEVLPVMKRQRFGRIIIVSSVGGVVPIAYDAFYSSSKAAINMLCLESRLELNKYNVFLTAVMPGGTATKFSFKRRIYQLSSDLGYADLATAVDALYRIEQGGATAASVAKTVLICIKRKHPPVVVASGLVNKLSHLSAKLLPQKVLLAVCKLLYGKGR